MAKIDKDTEITVVNNTHGSFVYSFKGINFELEDNGDEDTLTFGELKTISSGRHKQILRSLDLLITEVDSDEYTVEDVLKQLKLEKYYDSVKTVIKEDDINTDSLTDFVENCSLPEFEKALKIDSLRASLVEASVELYKNKKFNDFDKRKAVGDSIDVTDFNDFFVDIKTN